MFETLSIENLECDRVLTLPNTSWEDYEKLCHKSNSGLRISYLNNEITIVSPSRNHERIVFVINTLIIAYCEKYQIKFWGFGSEDIKEKFLTGKQPDNSYCFGVEKEKPDLAIEVNYTSGSEKDLNKYKLLKVSEVWMWQDDKITFYHLEDGEYKITSYSPNLYNPDAKLFLYLKSDFLNPYILRGLTEDNLTIKADFQQNL